MERFVARNSRRRLALMLAGAIVFVVGSLWLAGLFGTPPRPGREWVGWVGAAAFALAAAVAGLRLRDDGDQIVIDDAGFTWRPWSDEHIPWEAVDEIQQRSIRGQMMFAVYLRDLKAHPPTRLIGKVAASQAGMGMGHMSITAAGTDRDADELRDALHRFFVSRQTG